MYKKFNKKINSEVITIAPGEIYVSKLGEVVSTVLGSCISVCLYDKINRVGGMNHFMLPFDKSNDVDFTGSSVSSNLGNKLFRYGIFAMEQLIAEMQKKGGYRSNFEAKVFGGGNVIHTGNKNFNVGHKNIEFANFFLKMEGIPILISSTGDNYGREVIFYTDTNKVLQKKIATRSVKEMEESYVKSVKVTKDKSDITLF